MQSSSVFPARLRKRFTTFSEGGGQIQMYYITPFIRAAKMCSTDPPERVRGPSDPIALLTHVEQSNISSNVLCAIFYPSSSSLFLFYS